MNTSDRGVNTSCEKPHKSTDFALNYPEVPDFTTACTVRTVKDGISDPRGHSARSTPGSLREWLGHLRYQRLTRKCRSRTVGRCRHRPLWSGLPVLCHCSPGTVPTSCTTSTAHTRPNVACPHHIYHTGTVTPSVFSRSTSTAPRTPVFIPIIVRRMARTP